MEINHWKRQYSLQRALPLNKNLEFGSRTVDPFETEQPAEQCSILTTNRMSSSEEVASNGMDEVELRPKKSDVSEPKVRVSIGTFEKKREPSKLDYLPTRNSLRTDKTSDTSNISVQLHEELTQTFSRARLRQRIPDAVVAEGEFSVATSGPEVSKAPVRPASLPARPNTGQWEDALIIELKSRTKEIQEIKEDKEVTASAAPRPTVIVIGGSTNGSTNKEAGVPEERKKTPSWPTINRKPSAQIQAKMASLAAAAASASPAAAEAAAAQAAVAVVSEVSPPAEGIQSHPPLKNSITQSADNKITIQINPYVSNRSLHRN